MDWIKAEEHIRELQEIYRGIGMAGMFALITIDSLITRLENGERTQFLYDGIMECNSRQGVL